MNLSWDQVLAWRLRRQFIAPPAARSVREVVQRLCGVQAQVPASADLAIAVRRAESVHETMQQALDAHAVMRTWAMRGTLHLLAPEEAGAFLSLLADLRSWEKPGWQRSFGVSPSEMTQLAEAAEQALDRRVLSREALVVDLIALSHNRHLADVLSSGWGAVLKPLAWMGLLCNGPSEGNRVTFTSPQTWIAGWSGLPAPVDAARTAIRAYLGAYGPATLASFDAWLTRGRTSKTKLRAWFKELEDELFEIDVDGEYVYALAEHIDELHATPPARGVHLLPAFDQYVLGPGTACEQIISPRRRRQVSKAAGWISPVVVADGRVAGVWAIAEDTLAIELFTEEGVVADKRLADAVARIADLLGKDLHATVTRS